MNDENGRKLILRQSLAKSSSKRQASERSFSIKGKRLGYMNAIAAGDAVMQELKQREEFRAQHGAMRITFLDGQPVPAEDQLLSKAEIRQKRGQR